MKTIRNLESEARINDIWRAIVSAVYTKNDSFTPKEVNYSSGEGNSALGLITFILLEPGNSQSAGRVMADGNPYARYLLRLISENAKSLSKSYFEELASIGAIINAGDLHIKDYHPGTAKPSNTAEINIEILVALFAECIAKSSHLSLSRKQV